MDVPTANTNLFDKEQTRKANLKKAIKKYNSSDKGKIAISNANKKYYTKCRNELLEFRLLKQSNKSNDPIN